MGGSGIGSGFTLDGRDFIPLRGYDESAFDNEGKGYSLYNRYVLELRVPVTLAEPMPMWLVGFAEAGNGYDGFRDF